MYRIYQLSTNYLLLYSSCLTSQSWASCKCIVTFNGNLLKHGCGCRHLRWCRADGQNVCPWRRFLPVYTAPHWQGISCSVCIVRRILWFRAYGAQGLCRVILLAFQAEPGKWVANGGGVSDQYNSARQCKLAKKAHLQLLFEADIQHSQDKVYTLAGELRFAEWNHHICPCNVLLWFSHARSVCKPDIEFCKLHKFGAAGVCWRDKAK